MCYNLPCHSPVESAFLFLSNSRLSVRVPQDCDKLEKRQVGGSLIRGTMKLYCKGCDSWKDTSDFYVNPASKSGYRSLCKPCWVFRSNHGPNSKEHRRKYNQSEKGKEDKRRWAEVNKEKKKVFDWLWRSRNREKCNDRLKRWRKNNPDKSTVYKQNRRAHEKVDGTFTAQEWQDLKRRYEYKCLCCGKKEPEIKLSPDHVVPLSWGGRNSIDNIQPLCTKCNFAKNAKWIDYR